MLKNYMVQEIEPVMCTMMLMILLALYEHALLELKREKRICSVIKNYLDVSILHYDRKLKNGIRRIYTIPYFEMRKFFLFVILSLRVFLNRV